MEAKRIPSAIEFVTTRIIPLAASVIVNPKGSAILFLIACFAKLSFRVTRPPRKKFLFNRPKIRAASVTVGFFPPKP